MHQPPYDPMMVGHPQVHDPHYLGPPAALFPSSQRQQGPWKWQEKERERDEAIKERDEYKSKYEKLQIKIEQDARLRALEIDMQQRMDRQLADVKQQHAAKAAEPKKKNAGPPPRDSRPQREREETDKYVRLLTSLYPSTTTVAAIRTVCHSKGISRAATRTKTKAQLFVMLADLMREEEDDDDVTAAGAPAGGAGRKRGRGRQVLDPIDLDFSDDSEWDIRSDSTRPKRGRTGVLSADRR